MLTQKYNPKFMYLKGQLNCLADALSRTPYNMEDVEKGGQDL